MAKAKTLDEKKELQPERKRTFGASSGLSFQKPKFEEEKPQEKESENIVQDIRNNKKSVVQDLSNDSVKENNKKEPEGISTKTILESEESLSNAKTNIELDSIDYSIKKGSYFSEDNFIYIKYKSGVQKISISQYLESILRKDMKTERQLTFDDIKILISKNSSYGKGKRMTFSLSEETNTHLDEAASKYGLKLATYFNFLIDEERKNDGF